MQVEFEILFRIVCREGGRGKKKNILNQPKFISVPGFGPKTSREAPFALEFTGPSKEEHNEGRSGNFSPAKKI